MNGVDPKYVFWLGVLVTIEQGVAGGAVSLTNMVPEAWIPVVLAWDRAMAFVGTAVMTALTGVASSAKGPLIK